MLQPLVTNQLVDSGPRLPRRDTCTPKWLWYPSSVRPSGPPPDACMAGQWKGFESKASRRPGPFDGTLLDYHRRRQALRLWTLHSAVARRRRSAGWTGGCSSVGSSVARCCTSCRLVGISDFANARCQSLFLRRKFFETKQSALRTTRTKSKFAHNQQTTTTAASKHLIIYLIIVYIIRR